MYEKIKLMAEEIRPIILEKHDFSAELFKNKNSREPLFHLSAKGDFKIDIVKILAWLLLALATMSAFSISLQCKKQRKEKYKKMKLELKEARRNAR